MPGGQFCHLLPLGIQALPLGRVKGLLGGQDALQGIQLLGRVLGCPGVLVRGFLKSLRGAGRTGPHLDKRLEGGGKMVGQF